MAENKQMDRESQIAYLRDLFRLTFRVPEVYAQILPKELGSEAAVDEALNVETVQQTVYWGDDEVAEMNEYREDFAALDALDVFNGLCLDYYQDQLKAQKMRLKKLQALLELYDHDDPEAIEQMSTKARRHYDQIRNRCLDQIMLNHKSQTELKAKITALKSPKKVSEVTPEITIER